ncbi:MAG TPA: hypothetical protein VGQ53_16570 [Chitinophagaceae bacterium]|jgi:hypothetical protein|nr:hypothetical protein [Chitinophagaceae bacterium]
MKKIIECKFILFGLFSLACLTQIHAQSQDLKKFEGYYQFTDDTTTYLQITSQGNNLTLHQLWDDKEIRFERKSELEFFNQEYSFPLKFSSDQNGNVTQVVAFDRDLWNKVKNYKPTINKEIYLSSDQLKAFEGKYTFQFDKGQDSYLQITAAADHLTLKQLWDGKEINFVPKSNLEFFCKGQSFPLKFIKDDKGNVIQVLAFNKDLWQKVKE